MVYVRHWQAETLGQYLPLSEGEKGVDETVEIMRRMVLQSLADPAVKELAATIVKGIPYTDSVGYAKAVYQFAKDRMQYVPDTAHIEEITAPAIHARRFLSAGRSWGDCDDFSTLQAALLKSVGVPVRFAVIASPRNKGAFDHVRLEAYTKAGWLPLESTIAKSKFGQSFRALRSKIYPIE